MYGAFLRPGGRFFAVKAESLSAKKRTAFRKDETFLPQGSFCGCRREGETRLRRAFPALDGVRPHANPVCPFASHSHHEADARGGGQPHGVPWRAAKCRGNRLPAFILHSLGRARFAHFRPVAARARLRDSCRGCLDVLTGCHWGLIALRRPFGTFATRGGLRHRNRQGSFRGPSFFPSRNC